MVKLPAIAAGPERSPEEAPPPVLDRDGVAAAAAAAAAPPPTGAAVAPPGRRGSRRRRRSEGGVKEPLVYHYVVGKGNNSWLVLAALRARPWFVPAKAETVKTARRVFYWEMYRNEARFPPSSGGRRLVVCNHLEGNGALVTKKGLHMTMRAHCDGLEEPMAAFMPLSFHLVAGRDDAERTAFEECFLEEASKAASKSPTVGDEGGGLVRSEGVERSRTADAAPASSSSSLSSSRADSSNITKRRRRRLAKEATNVWIVKPAAMSNRGFGIRVSSSVEEIRGIVDSGEARSDARCGGWIVQKYIERPLLIRRRKFDVRVFALVVARPPRFRGSKPSEEGEEAAAAAVPPPALEAYVHATANYVRTSCERYTLTERSLSDRFVHLTNDGVQNHSAKYGKYEAGNKLSLTEFRDELVAAGVCAPDWLEGTFLPRVRALVALSVEAARQGLNPKRRPGFELFGYDFMVDDALDVKLIEVNSNPCLELCCPFLEAELPRLICDVLAVGLDAVCPPPAPDRCSRRQAQALKALKNTPNGFVPLKSPPGTLRASSSTPLADDDDSLS